MIRDFIFFKILDQCDYYAQNLKTHTSLTYVYSITHSVVKGGKRFKKKVNENEKLFHGEL